MPRAHARSGAAAGSCLCPLAVAPRLCVVQVLLAAVAVAVSGQINPLYKSTLVLYHMTPAQDQDVGLRNQDTGDLQGDAYFVLRSFILPIECQSNKAESKNDCVNPEQNDTTTNVVSMNLVDVDTRYGGYGSCNVHNGEYSCACKSGFRSTRCNASVGRVDVSTRESAYAPGRSGEDWQWWRVNLARKMGGYWYSTIDVGECPPATLPFNQSLRHAGTRGGARPREETETETECYWEVQRRVRTITSECLLDRVRDAVVQHNSTCFRGCAQPSNITSTCFVDCFMSNVLGPRGGSALIAPADGIPVTVIETGWKGAFAAVADGGCPDPVGPPRAHQPAPVS